MRQIRLGRTNIQVSPISAGTWAHSGPHRAGPAHVGWAGHDDDLARDALITAFEEGITHFDTADGYGSGRAERVMARVWQIVPRDQVFVASKVGYEWGDYSRPYHPELVRSHLHQSLANLDTDVIDLFYLHHCDFGPDDVYLDDALAVLHEAKDAGKIRFIGLSDWDARKIVRLLDRVDPDVVQPLRNVVDDDYVESGLRAEVERRDLGVAFFSPLKHGLLLGKHAEPTVFPDGDFRRNVPEFADASALQRYRAAAEALGVRFADEDEPVLHGLLGALLAGNDSATVLVGVRNPTQARAAGSVGEPLSADDAAWVAARYRGA